MSADSKSPVETHRQHVKQFAPYADRNHQAQQSHNQLNPMCRRPLPARPAHARECLAPIQLQGRLLVSGSWFERQPVAPVDAYLQPDVHVFLAHPRVPAAGIVLIGMCVVTTTVM